MLSSFVWHLSRFIVDNNWHIPTDPSSNYGKQDMVQALKMHLFMCIAMIYTNARLVRATLTYN